MTQSRLNSLYIQNALDLKEIANEFTARNEWNRYVWEVLISHGVLRVQFKL